MFDFFLTNDKKLKKNENDKTENLQIIKISQILKFYKL